MPGWVPKAIALFWLGFATLWLARGIVHSLRSFFLVLLISLFLSFAIEPAVNRMERAGLRRGLGTGLVFGQFRITAIEDTRRSLIDNGAPRVVDFTLSLIRVA